MAVHSFATNNLVKEHDIYVRYIKARKEYINENNIHPEPHLFVRGRKILDSINTDNLPYTSLNRCISKWHCMRLAYHFWHELASECRVYNGTIGHKKTVHVPDDILKEFKKKVEKAIIDNNCDYNRRLPHTKCTYDACRYLAMYWTYLDLVKDEVSQRFYPDPDTWKRAAKIFGYDKDENPFQMNGMYFDWKQKSEEETKMEEINGDILEKSLEDLDFSVRTENCLRRAGVKKFRSLLMLTANDILHIRNLGINSFREVVSKLQEYGYTYPEDKTNPRIPYVRDCLPVKEQEESVIDIAEQAAKEVEEEKSNSAEMVHPYDYNALLEKYNKLNEAFENLRKTALEATEKYDELLKQKMELEAYIPRLKDDICSLKEQNEVLKLQAKPKTDIVAILKDVTYLMKRANITSFVATIDGMTIDIRPDPVKPAAYQIRTSEVR